MPVSGEGTIGLLFKIVADGDDVPKTMRQIEQAIAGNLNLLKKLFASVESASEKACAKIERDYSRIQQTAQRAERERVRFANQAAKEIATSLDATTRKWAEEAAKQSKISANLAKEHVANQQKALRTIDQAGNGLRNAGLAVSALITAPLILSGKAAVDAATKYESARLKLESITGSAKEANRQFAELQKLAKLPAVDLASAVSDAAKLQASGFSFGQAQTLIRNISNLSARAGGTADDTSEVLRQLAQLQGKGKFSQADFNVIFERVPELGKLIRQEFGGATAETMRDANVSVARFIATLEGFTPEKVGLAKLSFAERFANIRQDIERALVPIGEVIIRNVLPALERLTPLIVQLSESFAALSPFAQNVIIALGAVAAAIGPVLIIVGTLLSSISSIIGFFGLFAPAAASVAAGGTALSAAWAGVVSVFSAIAAPVAIAIAAIVALYAAWKTNFGGIRELTAQATDFIAAQWGEVVGWFDQNLPLIQEIAETVLKALKPLFEFYSNNIKATWNAIWPVMSQAMQTWGRFVGGTLRAILQILNGDFDKARTTMHRTAQAMWAGIQNIFILGARAMVNVVRSGFNNLLGLVGLADSTGRNLGNTLARAILAGIAAFAPNIFAAVRSIVSLASGQLKTVGSGQKTPTGSPSSSFDDRALGEQANAELQAQRKLDAALKNTGGGGKLPKGGGGGGSGAKDISAIQQSVELLKVEESAIKRRYEAEIKDAKAAFDAKESDYQTYAEIAERAETRILNAKLATIRKEREEAQKSDLLPRQKIVKLAQIAESEASAIAESNQRLQELADEKRKNDEKELNEYLALLRRKEEADDEWLKNLIESRRNARQAEQEFNARIRGLIAERKQIEADLLRQSAAQLERAGGNPALVAERRFRAEAAEENARSQRVLQSIAQDKQANFERAQTYQQYIETLSQLNQLEESERRRHAAVLADISRDLQIARDDADPLSDRSLFGDELANRIEAGQGRLQAFASAAQNFFQRASQSAGNFASIAGNAVNRFNQGLAQTVQNFILTGQTGSAALKKLTATVIAEIAAQSIVKAIFEAAAGFASLAVGDTRGAALHFKAAALYGAVGVTAAAVGRAVAGDSFSNAQGSAGSQSAAGSALNPAPYAVARNSQIALGQQSQQEAFAASSRVNLQGITEATANLNSAVGRLSAMPAGQVVGIGLNENPQAAGVAVIKTANTDSGFTDNLGRRLNLR